MTERVGEQREALALRILNKERGPSAAERIW